MFGGLILCLFFGLILGQQIGTAFPKGSPFENDGNSLPEVEREAKNVFAIEKGSQSDFSALDSISELSNVPGSVQEKEKGIEEPVSNLGLRKENSNDEAEQSNFDIFDHQDQEAENNILINKGQDEAEKGSQNKSPFEDSESPSDSIQLGNNQNDNEDVASTEEDNWYHDPDNVKEIDLHDIDEGKEDQEASMLNNNDDDDEIDQEFWARFDSQGKDEDKDSNNDKEDDNEDESVLDGSLDDLEDDEEELLKKAKRPTAPTNMVLFYTWMIVAILVMVVGVSTYQAKCKGFLSKGNRPQPRGEDRKRLLDNEFV